ncbi:MAG: class I SAM-dependent methyltransferase [bacterium]
MRKFLRDPEGAITDKITISNLIYGWGNEDWSAMEEYISACLTHVSMSEGDILECGSGLTTILIGALAKRRGRIVWALEHNRDWAKRVERYLKRYHLHSVRLCFSPLKDFGEFSWYTPPLESMPREFALVVCDGPPGDTQGGRYGLLPVMIERLIPGAVILLDDAAREGEKAGASRWADEFGAGYTLCGTAKPYFETRMPDSGGSR